MNRMNVQVRKSRGFTLLEMLLALVIFTLVSLAAWQILSSVSYARDVQGDHQKRLDELDTAFLMIKQDLRQMVSRGVRVDSKVSEQALFAGEILDSDDQGLIFVRDGWLNPENRLPRSELQRVYYRLKDGALERGYDRVLDVPAGTDPVYMPLLTGVTNLKFRFYYPGQGRWLDRLEEESWPEGLAVALTLDKEGDIERRFVIPSRWGGTDE
ncbi:type II secretion system minor pseudopilin GspJ [Sansalvadorimonas sp. 2012CJ34-2]|uniref:Type II secretion system protein J n=1 Tax=Parendozoicomonas callyspongiae TaxID=2942213 RepID=A0ABT0PBI4_9GAMM|nr:type II secretion system minor pseudopilin GspJ [Sansalvadorimonas sp. 2012CJ34-2]MCL6268744.1 type II secretion system minor pseudopilin GspJ [Sansalvadorimonas sp. 2012CJ34-2]